MTKDGRISVLSILGLLVVLGCVSAQVSAESRQKGNSKSGKEDQTKSSQSRFTDVFVWRDGRWQIVAGHSSRIPKPKQ